MSTNSTSEPRELTETPDLNGAYPRLDEAGIAALAPLGRRRRVQPEEVLFREGDRDCEFFVVLAGMVASVEGFGTAEENVISVHGRGRFLGELSLLTGEALLLHRRRGGGRRGAGRAGDQLRELVARDQGIGDLILRAYLIRRSILIGLGAGLRIIGSRYSPDARRLRDFAARNRLPYRWLDLDSDPGAEALLARFGVAPHDTPIVILHGRMLRNPGNAELAAAAGLPGPERLRGRAVTCSWSGPARPGCPPPCTARRKACAPWCSTAPPPAARPGRRRGSRTTSASRPASPGPNWPNGRCCRPASSAPSSRCPPRPRRSRRTAASTWSG